MVDVHPNLKHDNLTRHEEDAKCLKLYNKMKASLNQTIILFLITMFYSKQHLIFHRFVSFLSALYFLTFVVLIVFYAISIYSYYKILSVFLALYNISFEPILHTKIYVLYSLTPILLLTTSTGNHQLTVYICESAAFSYIHQFVENFRFYI